MRRVVETGRMLIVDSLLQVTVKKHILHVKLMNGPATRGSNAEDDTDGGRFNNRAERLDVVDAMALSEATDHSMGLLMSESAVGVEFMLINPFARHNVGTRMSVYKSPIVVVDQGVVLIHHGRPPLWVSEGAPIVPQDRGDRRGGRDVRRRSREAEVIDRLQ